MKKLMSVLVVVFFVATAIAQDVIMQDMSADKKQKPQPSFLVHTSWMDSEIREGTAFSQCKQLAELMTVREGNIKEVFSQALSKMDANLPEVKAFKTWGEYLAAIPPAAIDSDYAQVNSTNHKSFWDQTLTYGLINTSIETDDVFVAQVNGMRIGTITIDTPYFCIMFDRGHGDEEFTPLKYNGKQGYYLVKMLPQYGTIRITTPKK